MINTSAFYLLAGKPEAWDNEIKEKCRPGCYENTFNSEDLCTIQVQQYARGRRSIQLCESIYGWYLRSSSGLDGNEVIARVASRGGILSGSIEDAIKWGINWANAAPEKREFFASKSDIDKNIPDFNPDNFTSKS